MLRYRNFQSNRYGFQYGPQLVFQGKYFWRSLLGKDFQFFSHWPLKTPDEPQAQCAAPPVSSLALLFFASQFIDSSRSRTQRIKRPTLERHVDLQVEAEQPKEPPCSSSSPRLSTPVSPHAASPDPEM